MATESQVMTAVLAAINANMPAAKQATEPSKVTIAERTGSRARSGRSETRGWQVYVFAASSTSEANARNSLDKAHTALVNKVLTVGSERSTPIALGPARPVGPDDGWFSGSKSYLFTI